MLEKEKLRNDGRVCESCKTVGVIKRDRRRGIQYNE